jgi:hypothetical protein
MLQKGGQTVEEQRTVARRKARRLEVDNAARGSMIKIALVQNGQQERAGGHSRRSLNTGESLPIHTSNGKSVEGENKETSTDASVCLQEGKGQKGRSKEDDAVKGKQCRKGEHHRSRTKEKAHETKINQNQGKPVKWKTEHQKIQTLAEQKSPKEKQRVRRLTKEGRPGQEKGQDPRSPQTKTTKRAL